MPRINTEIATIFIAFIAVLLAVWEGIEFRQHNKMSVKPVLNSSVSKSFGEINNLKLAINSVGLGPAKITGFHVYYNGEEEEEFSVPGYSTRYFNIKQAARGALDGDISILDQGLSNGDVLMVGRTLTLFSLEFSATETQNETRKVFSAVDQTTDIFICYCSLYDDQCNIEHIGSHPELAPENCRVDD